MMNIKIRIQVSALLKLHLKNNVQTGFLVRDPVGKEKNMNQRKINRNHSYFSPGWELELEEHNLTSGKLEKVYICSPLGAETVPEIRANMHYAREFMCYATKLFECVAVAPHAYLPVLLNDTVADERYLGLKFGIELLSMCSHIFVCGSRISTGMAAEIKYAAKKAIRIHVFNEDAAEKVKELCEGTNARITCHFGGDYVPLSVHSPKRYLNDKADTLSKLFK